MKFKKIDLGTNISESLIGIFLRLYKPRILALVGGDNSNLVDEIEQQSRQFLEQRNNGNLTAVPFEKTKKDLEFIMRSQIGDFSDATDIAKSVTDDFVADTRRIPERDDGSKDFSFMYAIDLVCRYLKQHTAPKERAATLFYKLLEHGRLFNPLGVRNFLVINGKQLSQEENIDQLFEQKKPEFDRYASEVGDNNITTDIFRRYVRSEEDEGRIFEGVGTVDLGRKVLMYAVDGQRRGFLTYEQVRRQTVERLASIAIYGIVAGVVYGSETNQEHIFTSLDRPDIDLLNYETDYQCVIMIAVNSPTIKQRGNIRVRENTKVRVGSKTQRSLEISVMKDKEDNLPEIPADELNLIVPSTLLEQVQRGIIRKGYEAGRTEEEMKATLERCIPYHSRYWGSIHRFNEWLLTTDIGREIVSTKVRTSWNDLLSIDEIVHH